MSRTIVVSNRVPVPARSGPDQAQAGGLSVVMRESLEERGGIWFGWSGEVVSNPSAAPRLVTRDNVTFATIDLSKSEHEGYYTGFANGVLWPLMHLMPHLVQYRRQDADMYRQVNARMADALVPLLKPDDMIWIQDYHLLLLPAELRGRGVKNPIGFFLHIPFPSADMLSTVPGMDRLVRGMLAADLVGMQTTRDVSNFIAAACQIGQARQIEPGAAARRRQHGAGRRLPGRDRAGAVRGAGGQIRQRRSGAAHEGEPDRAEPGARRRSARSREGLGRAAGSVRQAAGAQARMARPSVDAADRGGVASGSRVLSQSAPRDRSHRRPHQCRLRRARLDAGSPGDARRSSATPSPVTCAWRGCAW